MFSQLAINMLYSTHVIWRTISMVNWDVMHIGAHLSYANRAILSVHCFMTLHDACDYKQCWHKLNLAIEAKIANLESLPNVSRIRYAFV